MKILKNLYKKYFGRYVYHKFPFPTTTPLPPTATVQMQRGCQILDELEIPYTLADGTLLAVYRDNKLIAHDTDIDVAVVTPVDYQKIETAFIENGFTLGRKVMYKGAVMQSVFYAPDKTLFDIIYYTRYGEDVYNFCEDDYYFKHREYHYRNTGTIVFEGFKYKIPDDPQGWLEETYGKNWRTPAKSAHNDWRQDETFYAASGKYDGVPEKVLKEAGFEMKRPKKLEWQLPKFF